MGVLRVPETAKKTVENGVALEALNEIVEAYFDFSGNKEARGVMRALAARVATPVQSPKVVPMRGRAEVTSDQLAAKAWLQERLPVWLHRHG